MLSIRQLEAFVWTVRLKTLSRAAAKLNMAQPTISKRIQELELACGFEVFDKVGRSVAVTPQGTLLYELAEKILSLVSQVEDIRDQPPESPRTIALGVTELAAYTWLPRLVNLLAERFPLVTSHVVIEQSASLLTKLRTGELDLIVTPSFVPERDFIDIRASDVPMALMASPHLCRRRHVYTGAELSQFTLLAHGARTGSIKVVGPWMRDLGWAAKATQEFDSIAAQVGLAVAGMGLTMLPKECFQFLVGSGSLIELKTTMPPPTLQYRIVYPQHEERGIVAQIAKTMQEVADFTRGYQTG